MLLRAEKRSSAGDAALAMAELNDALGLWRGDALVDCRAGGWASAEAHRLDDLRLSTVEDRIDAGLMLGQHGAAVGELESLLTQHPYRERLWASLMLALYRSGRQADSVRAFQRAREMLVGELGMEPGRELRRLEAAVLANDPILDSPEAPRAAEGDELLGELTIPLPRRMREAPSALFVGREPELHGLQRSLRAAASGQRRVVLLSRRAWDRQDVPGRGLRPRRRPKVPPCCTDAAMKTWGSPISPGSMPSPTSLATRPKR